MKLKPALPIRTYVINKKCPEISGHFLFMYSNYKFIFSSVKSISFVFLKYLKTAI